jgi:hypothetical protein
VILGVTDARVHGLWRDDALLDLEVLHHSLDHLQLVRGIIDSEVASIAQRFDLAPQQADAERVKRRNQRIAGPRSVKQTSDASLHLVRSLVGERDSKDGVRPDLQIVDQMRDSVVMTRVLPLPAPARMRTGLQLSAQLRAAGD